VKALEEARRAGSQNPELLNDLGVAYARLGRSTEARHLFQQLIARDPRAAGTWYNLGLLEARDRRVQPAIDAFQQAVDANPAYGEAWQALGAVTLNVDALRAIEAWKRAERLRPADYDLLFNLGMTLAARGRSAEALPYLQRFVREAPRDRYASDLAAVQKTIERADAAR
jgi:tetratricopeptide (TPR) repeat protein